MCLRSHLKLFRMPESVRDTLPRLHRMSRFAAICGLIFCGGTTAVAGDASPRRFNFENDIIPILSRFGCNASGCHGKAEGQNGFKLSVFGFDPPADYVALTQEGRGRRTIPSLPEKSLLLSKASGRVPHGGGVRISRGSGEYRTLHDWIAAGMPF